MGKINSTLFIKNMKYNRSEGKTAVKMREGVFKTKKVIFYLKATAESKDY